VLAEQLLRIFEQLSSLQEQLLAAATVLLLL
jgi:hypothetical protein